MNHRRPMSRRAKLLTANAYVALAAAVFTALFGVTLAWGAGRWLPAHWLILAAVAAFGAAALACLVAADRIEATRIALVRTVLQEQWTARQTPAAQPKPQPVVEQLAIDAA